MLEGDPEVPFTSPSAISHSHTASAPAESSGRSTCGSESGPRNLYPQSNANFQFNTLGKQKRDHTEHSGQEALECDLSWAAVDSGKDSAVHYMHPVPVCMACTQLHTACVLFDGNNWLTGINSAGLWRVQPECRRKSSSRAKLNWERTGWGEINSRYAFVKESKVMRWLPQKQNIYASPHYCVHLYSFANTAE